MRKKLLREVVSIQFSDFIKNCAGRDFQFIIDVCYSLDSKDFDVPAKGWNFLYLNRHAFIRNVRKKARSNPPAAVAIIQ